MSTADAWTILATKSHREHRISTALFVFFVSLKTPKGHFISTADVQRVVSHKESQRTQTLHGTLCVLCDSLWH